MLLRPRAGNCKVALSVVISDWMKIDDSSITACLDGKWCTLVQIRSRLGLNTNNSGDLPISLERLADAGKIERLVKETGVPKRRGSKSVGSLSIHFYRRRNVL